MIRTRWRRFVCRVLGHRERDSRLMQGTFALFCLRCHRYRVLGSWVPSARHPSRKELP